jgi:hypothetical protein
MRATKLAGAAKQVSKPVGKSHAERHNAKFIKSSKKVKRRK